MEARRGREAAAGAIAVLGALDMIAPQFRHPAGRRIGVQTKSARRQPAGARWRAVLYLMEWVVIPFIPDLPTDKLRGRPNLDRCGLYRSPGDDGVRGWLVQFCVARQDRVLSWSA